MWAPGLPTSGATKLPRWIETFSRRVFRRWKPTRRALVERKMGRASAGREGSDAANQEQTACPPGLPPVGTHAATCDALAVTGRAGRDVRPNRGIQVGASPMRNGTFLAVTVLFLLGCIGDDGCGGVETANCSPAATVVVEGDFACDLDVTECTASLADIAEFGATAHFSAHSGEYDLGEPLLVTGAASLVYDGESWPLEVGYDGVFSISVLPDVDATSRIEVQVPVLSSTSNQFHRDGSDDGYVVVLSME